MRRPSLVELGAGYREAKGGDGVRALLRASLGGMCAVLSLVSCPALAADSTASAPATTAASAPAAMVLPLVLKYVTGEPNAAPIVTGARRPEIVERAFQNCVYNPAREKGPNCTADDRYWVERWEYNSTRCELGKAKGNCEIIATDMAFKKGDFVTAAMYYQRACDLGYMDTCSRALAAKAKAANP